MTVKAPLDTQKSELTLSEGPEDRQWSDRGYVLGGAQPVVLGERGPERIIPIRQATVPRRIDWWRVLALVIVAVTASLTFIGLYAVLVFWIVTFG